MFFFAKKVSSTIPKWATLLHFKPSETSIGAASSSFILHHSHFIFHISYFIFHISYFIIFLTPDEPALLLLARLA
jgi:hypothetical protein